jgi:hypothetical protein
MEIEPDGSIFIYGRAIGPPLQAISFPVSS